MWVLFLKPNGTVKTHQKISATEGGFEGELDYADHFAASLAASGDLDGDGVIDLAVGASTDDDGGPERGAVWVLFLNRDGTVKSHVKISSTQGGFTGALDDSDVFGWSVAPLGDIDGNRGMNIVVGAPLDDDGCTIPANCRRGAVWLLSFDGIAACPWDLDGNGDVGLLDLPALLTQWGTNPGGPPDFDGDGVVAVPDLLTLLAAWGPCQ